MTAITKFTGAALLAGALILPAQIASAAPILYEGTATVVPGAVDNANGFLTDFLAAVPMAGDQVSFSATFDADTLFQDTNVPPGTIQDVEFYRGGITEISFTIGATTLSATPNIGFGETSLIVTTADTDQLGIPGFKDGYAITVGSPLNDDPRWGVNLFFSNANGGLDNLDPLTALPNPDDFEFVGFGFRSFRGAAVPGQLFDGFGALLDDLEDVTDPGNGGGGNPPVTVSEPGSIALLFGGLAIGAFVRRRKG